LLKITHENESELELRRRELKLRTRMGEVEENGFNL